MRVSGKSLSRSWSLSESVILQNWLIGQHNCMLGRLKLLGIVTGSLYDSNSLQALISLCINKMPYLH